MKKLLLIAFTILLFAACKKKEYSPEGPTDVRIRNLTTYDLHDVTIDIDTIVNYGVINTLATSNYIRFPKAYAKAKITAKANIDGSPVTFSSGNVDYTYMPTMGRMRITYEIVISNSANKTIEVKNVIPEEELLLD